jgi:hypothetical protein
MQSQCLICRRRRLDYCSALLCFGTCSREMEFLGGQLEPQVSASQNPSALRRSEQQVEAKCHGQTEDLVQRPATKQCEWHTIQGSMFGAGPHAPSNAIPPSMSPSTYRLLAEGGLRLVFNP